MGKLTLQPNPTFTATVKIPVPGSRPSPVEFTFRNRNREDLAAWLESLDGRPTEAAVLEMATGWDLDDGFDAANVALLMRNYIGAWQAIYDTYLGELVKAREKN
jgi:hypothetical protein